MQDTLPVLFSLACREGNVCIFKQSPLLSIHMACRFQTGCHQRSWQSRYRKVSAFAAAPGHQGEKQSSLQLLGLFVCEISYDRATVSVSLVSTF